MRLLSLTLRDFRQFRGEQTIRFAGQDDRNVTVIYGANGTGKTTLLNAFTWALYGKFTEDLEQPEKPINKVVWEQAALGTELSAEAELEFEHDNRRYLVRRTARASKTDAPQRLPRPTEVTLRYSDTPGEYPTAQIGNPDVALDQILPERLHQFFFFNGERIERLAHHSAYAEIANATKTILGLEVLDRATRHIPQAAKTFEDELKKVGTSEQQEIVEERHRLQEEERELTEQLEQSKRNHAAVDDERDAVARQLAALEQSRQLQEERTRLEDEKLAMRQRLEGADAEVREVISDRGYLAFIGGLADKVQAQFQDLESRGELPTPMKRPFVEQLLSRAECICGTPLPAGSDAREKVEGYGKVAGPPEVEQRWIRLSGEAENVASEQAQLSSDLTRIIKRRSDDVSRLSLVDERLDEIDQKLGSFPHEEVRKLEERHRALVEQRDDLLREETRRVDALTRVKQAIAEADERSAKAQARDAQAALAQRRINVAREAERVVTAIYDSLQDEVRRELDQRIKRTFKQITIKPSEPELNDQFELRLWDLAGDGARVPSPRSTGENSILSLSFVGGLASLARDQAHGAVSQEPLLAALLGGQGGDFPIVMDAAFGALDLRYREEVARALPQLATQVIALLSKAQSSGEVENILGRLRGRAYVITYYTPVSGAEEKLSLNGQVYPYVVTSRPQDERAELNEITLDG